jgi:hypothetical protein
MKTIFPNWQVNLASGVAFFGPLLLLVLTLLGCSIPMMGGGEVYIGVQDNMFKIGHRVDRDLEGVTAKIALEVEASVLEALLGTSDEPPDEISDPDSSGPE